MVVIDKKSEDYVKPDNYVRSREEVIDFCRAYLARYTEDEPMVSKARKRWIVRTARECQTAEETISAMEAKMEKHFGEPVVEEPVEEEDLGED